MSSPMTRMATRTCLATARAMMAGTGPRVTLGRRGGVSCAMAGPRAPGDLAAVRKGRDDAEIRSYQHQQAYSAARRGARAYWGEMRMIRIKGRYRNQVLELDQPLNLADGTEVEIEIR